MIKFPIVIKCNWMLKIASWVNGFEVAGIEYIFPFVIVNDLSNEILIRHKTIHFRQMCETLVIGFYILYSFYYIKNRFKGMDHESAYDAIPFEMEAYKNEKNKNYLENRKKYCWIHY
jgi:hypothetical protein